MSSPRLALVALLCLALSLLPPPVSAMDLDTALATIRAAAVAKCPEGAVKRAAAAGLRGGAAHAHVGLGFLAQTKSREGALMRAAACLLEAVDARDVVAWGALGEVAKR